MTAADMAMLAGGGLVAGVVNTLAGGGSLLTVPLLVMVGLPGTVANGSNRLGVIAMGLTAMAGLRRGGVDGLRDALPLLPPLLLGSFLGAVVISQVADDTFEKMFGLLMLALLVPTLRKPRASTRKRPVGAWTRFLVFLTIGLYGGAFQAGVGILLVLAIAYTGTDLLRANSAKVALTLLFTLVAMPVFIAEGQVAWTPALVLAAGFAAGGWLGAHLALRGGEELIRRAVAVAVVVLAVRMLGLMA
jgi:uncharacterized membrane protein YfcA